MGRLFDFLAVFLFIKYVIENPGSLPLPFCVHNKIVWKHKNSQKLTTLKK